MDLQDFDIKLAEIKKKVDDTYAILSNGLLELEKLKKAHELTRSSIDKKVATADFGDQVSKILSFIDQIKKRVLLLEDQKDLMNGFLRDIKSQLFQVKDTVEDHSKKHVDTIKSVDTLSSSLKNADINIYRHMNTSISTVSQSINKKIEELPIPRDSINMEDARKEIASSTEMISLDAKNAHLVSKNNEIRLDILEKKMDNLLLEINNEALKKK